MPSEEGRYPPPASNQPTTHLPAPQTAAPQATMSPRSPLPPAPLAPSWTSRVASVLAMTTTGVVASTFLRLCNTLEVNGLDRFLDLLDEREYVPGRTRGLVTVSNHLSVLDEPLMWGALPLRCFLRPDNMRWALGSHDIVFKNRILNNYFLAGQVLPTYRLMHSPHGGLFQPTITEAIRLLSGPGPTAQTRHFSAVDDMPEIVDPFAGAALTYTVPPLRVRGAAGAQQDIWPSPSAYATRRHAWVHVYPEGRTHQRGDRTMRYFKWGVARMILEAEPCPDVVPMWIEGFEHVMHESRKFPRFVPRVGKRLSVTFGERVDGERVFGDLRERWRRLVKEEKDGGKREQGRDQSVDGKGGLDLGVVRKGRLRDGDEVRRLREECALRIREEVLKVRRSRGLPDEDPKVSKWETWKAEGGKSEGKMQDGSLVGRT